MPLEKLVDVVNAIDGVKNAINGRVEIAESDVLDHEDFTDNGDATGFIDTGIMIPAGAIFEGYKVKWLEAPTVDGVAGETDIELELGTAADPDRCNQATNPDTVLATGLPASFIQDPKNPGDVGDGDIVFTALTQLRVKATLIGGVPDFGNFVAAAASGKLQIVAMYRKTADL